MPLEESFVLNSEVLGLLLKAETVKRFKYLA